MVGSSPRASIGPLDVESAQIVNMALNLSESRRLASRKATISQATPPRLAHLPESTSGGSLRQHLQQQRRVSRTVSPKPDRSPRVASGRFTSPLHSSFEAEQPHTYQYHFSQSTIARAQKAMEYMELMAEHRRVLDLLPPLIPSRSTRASTASPPGTPNGSVRILRPPTNEPEVQIGRPYNPLQYIRNRKVRARERKAIDGEGQGFNDIPKVRQWVDDVAKWVATGQPRVPGNPALPPFATAHVVETQSPPQTAGSRPSTAIAKPKRPRVDWVIDPADMLADVYWLEQDDNKMLVEDRQWRRVFPQNADAYRPLSQGEADTRGSTPGSAKQPPDNHMHAEKSSSETQAHKSEHEHILSSARDRAQQKLRALRPTHNRNNSSINGRDFLRIHRGSLSESSDTDSDRKRRLRNVTISSSAKDVFAKRLDEMIAEEQRETEPNPPYHNREAQRMKFVDTEKITPGKDKSRGTSPLPSGGNSSHRRMDSRSDPNEIDGFFLKLKPRTQQALAGTAGLGAHPKSRRFSVDYDTSQPNSPDLRPIHESALVPAIGMDLSPGPSRPSSPHRNPLTKVKSIFRERSRDRIAELHSNGEDNHHHESPPAPSEKILESPRAEKDSASTPARRASKSPLRKVISRGTDNSNSHKSHKSTSSAKPRSEDGGTGSTGLRGLFRNGQRIDSVLRSGVSKVGDILWRRDAVVAGDEQQQFSCTSSDESDLEQVARGRSRFLSRHRRHDSSAVNSQSAKSYLDMMPPFQPVSAEAGGRDATKLTPNPAPGGAGTEGGLLIAPPTRPLSRQSQRFELLKPPRIDIQTASSPSPSPGPRDVTDQRRANHLRDWTGASTDSNKSVASGGSASPTGSAEGVRAVDARFNAMLALTAARGRQVSNASSAGGRHWSIADRGSVGSVGSARALPASGVTTVVSKREIARLRVLLLSSGIHAMEMDRRARERKVVNLPVLPNTKSDSENSDSMPPGAEIVPAFASTWSEVANMCPDQDIKRRLIARPIAQTDMYPLAARALRAAIETEARRWETATDKLVNQTGPNLEKRVDHLRETVGGQLTGLTRKAVEDADEAGHDLVVRQRLKVNKVVATIEKMLRRRRRRFRWVRRAGWLSLEWMLIGIMWYVWFVVMIARVIFGVGRGFVGAVRWLLWL